MDSRPTKAPHRPTPARDSFLADALRPGGGNHRRLTYGDGFRLGIGIITAQLLVLLLVGLLSWAFIAVFKLHT